MRSLAAIALCLCVAACNEPSPPVAHEEHVDVTPAAAGSCEHTEAAPPPAVVVTGPQPSAVLPDGSRQYGAALVDMTETSLAAIAAAPASFDGQTIRTAGQIERVCQRMGCWMELRAEGAAPVRVPMAGHSFFLPRDVVGHDATIEGRVLVTPLSPERRAHLESEGALATADELSIEATSVVVR